MLHNDQNPCPKDLKNLAKSDSPNEYKKVKDNLHPHPYPPSLNRRRMDNTRLADNGSSEGVALRVLPDGGYQEFFPVAFLWDACPLGGS